MVDIFTRSILLNSTELSWSTDKLAHRPNRKQLECADKLTHVPEKRKRDQACRPIYTRGIEYRGFPTE